MRRRARQLTRTAILGGLAAAVLAGGAPATASAQLELKRCRQVHPDARCGTVDVPLERGDPASRQLRLRFAVLRHTNRKEKPRTPVFVVLGGPGFAPSSEPDNPLFFFEGARRRHDLVLVDYRGEGRSEAINCRPLQRIETSDAAALQRAVGACGVQLGDAADDYSAADIADDVEAVRATLGYPLINFYGQSYGTIHGQAYALRHGSHLRSLILDGAFSPLSFDLAEQAGAGIAAAGARTVAIVCGRSPTCRRDNPHPARALARLAERLRSRPFSGVGRDAEGRRKRVRMNEAMLARIATQDDFAYTGQTELPAAFRALRHGDRKPLLRLAAFTGPDYSFEDDPKVESAGLNAASCVDFPTPWDVTAPLDVRRAQSASAFSSLPDSTFRPFSVSGWVRFWSPAEFCIEWPAPTDLQPVFVPGVRFPDVPTLVVAAELDLSTTVADGRFVADLFPRSRFVLLRNGGHTPGFYSQCSPPLYVRFINTLKTGDTSCVERGDADRPALGRFPRRARGAHPAKRRSGGADRSRRIDRRVAAVAWLTVQDALRLNGLVPSQKVRGVGLRGGRFLGVFHPESAVVTIDFDGTRFARDVAVDGRARLDFSHGSAVRARVRVNGPAGADGRLRLRGNWFSPDASVIRIRGRLGGRRVAAVVPAL
jgi:pimeloyl-ACP methyl ester carboxylesterase